ncbi:hypothetical protein OAH77_04340 [Flavobacteriaceae bacterium]|nr:hypothetical protein [Flavobacteriaceae bacterium]
MAVTYTSGELRLSGTVTNAQWYAAVSTAGLSLAAGNIYTQQVNVRVLSGADLSGLENIIINLNQREWIFEDTNPIIDTLTFIDSGNRAVPDRFIFQESGSGVLPIVRNCQFIGNISGNPGGADPRYLFLPQVRSASNCIFRTSDFSEQEATVQFVETSEFSDVSGVKIQIFIFQTHGEQARQYKVRNLTQSSSAIAGGGGLGVYSGSSLMLTNWEREQIGTSPNFNWWMNNYNGQQRDHYVYLLGTAASVYNIASGQILQLKNELHLYRGGHKIIHFINGEGGNFAVYNNTGDTPVRAFPTTASAEMLEVGTTKTVDNTETVEFLTLEREYAHNGTAFAETLFTEHRYELRRYAWNFLDVEVTDVLSVEGEDDSPVPALLTQNTRITETTKATVDAYTVIDDANELYDYVHTLLVDDMSIPVIMGFNGARIVIADGWILVRDQAITDAVEIDTVNSEIKVKTGASGLQATDQWEGFQGDVDTSFDGNTDMDFILVPNQTNFRFTNVVSGQNVTIINSTTSAQVVQGTATGTTLELTAAYALGDYGITIRSIRDGFQQTTITATATEGIVNIAMPNLRESFGYVTGAFGLHEVDGVEQNFGANGLIDLNTTTNVFDLTSSLETRQAFSSIMRSWDLDVVNQLVLPVNVDDVRGLSIQQPYTFGSTTLDNNRLTDEGYVERDANGDVTNFLYNLKIENYTVDVQWQLYVNDAAQGINTETGNINTLIDIDHTVNDVFIRVKAKHPQYNFKIVDENIIEDGVIVSDRFRLQETNYLVSIDTAVTADVRQTATVTRTSATVTVADSNSVDKTFSNGTIDLDSTTTTLQEVINQLAAEGASEFDENGKHFTLQNAGANINVEQGYYITIGGSPLSGALRGQVRLFDDNGDEFATPEYRSIRLSVPSSWQGNLTNYCIVADDADLLTATPDVLVDADSNETKGTIAAGSDVLHSIQTDTDTPLRIFWVADGMEFQQDVRTLTDAGINYEISPIAERVVLYKDDTLTVDDLDAGTKAWEAEIDNIVVDTTDREFIFPNAILSAELAYAYRRWRRWLEADIQARMEFGIALVALNQSRPDTATNNAHLQNPNVFISYAWKFNVRSDRTAVIELQASGMGRYETSHQLSEQNSGLIYVDPLANDERPARVITTGVTTQAISDIQRDLIIVKQKTDELTFDADSNVMADVVKIAGEDVAGVESVKADVSLLVERTDLYEFAEANELHPSIQNKMLVPATNNSFSTFALTNNGGVAGRVANFVNARISGLQLTAAIGQEAIVSGSSVTQGSTYYDSTFKFKIWNDTGTGNGQTRFGTVVYESSDLNVRDGVFVSRRSFRDRDTSTVYYYPVYRTFINIASSPLDLNGDYLIGFENTGSEPIVATRWLSSAITDGHVRVDGQVPNRNTSLGFSNYYPPMAQVQTFSDEDGILDTIDDKSTAIQAKTDNLNFDTDSRVESTDHDDEFGKNGRIFLT